MADDRDGFDWAGWAVPGGALLAVAVLFVVLVAPWNWLTPGPSADPSPSRPAEEGRTEDEHEVVTEAGIISFRFEDGAIVIRLTADGSTTELGQAELSFVATAPPDGTPRLLGISIFAMVCVGRDPTTAQRYVFGNVDSPGELEYAGPQAIGHKASDGLFLYALVPGASGGSMTVTATDGSSAGYGADAFERAANGGREQPSGCFIAG